MADHPDSTGDRPSPIAKLFTAYAGLQIVLALASIVRNKVTAISLGPAGFGEFAQLINISTLLVVAASLGMGVALGRSLAVTDDMELRRTTLGTAVTLSAAVSVVVVLVALVTLIADVFLPLAGLPPTRVLTFAALVAIVAVPITCLQGLYIAALQGLLDAQGVAKYRGVAVLVATLLGVPIILVWGLVGAVVSALLVALFVLVSLAVRLRQLGYSPMAFTWNRTAARGLLALGVVSTLAGVAHAGADVASRGLTLAAVGSRANGLIQAPLSLTALIQGVLLGSVGALSVAVVARASGPAEMRRELERMLDFMVPFAALAFAAMGAVSPLALRILYSERFVAADPLFPSILVYQFVVLLFWVLGSPLLAAGHVRPWLVLELVGAIAKVSLAAVLVPALGMIGLPISLLLFALLHLALNVVVVRRLMGITISASRYLGATAAAGSILACWWLPSHGTLGLMTTAAILVAILATCLKTFRAHS